MMRKVLAVAAVGVFLASCGTMKVVHNGGVPVEDSAFIMPTVGLRIVSCNSDLVNWGPGVWRGTEVQIPSGKQELSVTLTGVQRGNRIYSGGQFFFDYTYERGRSYLIVVRQVIYPNEITVGIRDRTTRKEDIVSAYPELRYRLYNLMSRETGRN